MEIEQRISYLRSLLGSPVWTDIIKPEQEKRFLALMKQAAIGRSSLSEAQLRCLLAEASEVERSLVQYENEIKDFDLTERDKAVEREQEEQEAKDGERQARLGFRSPYVGPPPAMAEDSDEYHG